ncbi:MAG: PQQ-binding-like beta-propeller repeat protein [Catenulispora sp.]|nr:PQQ-binding-like beta-propeller repeat protein [Catenulispora sp.]
MTIYTQRADNHRSGIYHETALTPGNVGGLTLKFTLDVDGSVFAQPLVASGSPNVAYVATMNNSVYAFNADTGARLWHRGPLAPAVPLPDPDGKTGPGGYRDISGQVGILSTPVVDTGAGFLYVLTSAKNNSNDYPHQLWKLRLSDGSTAGSTVISASARGVQFVPNLQAQRPGLLLNNGKIYLAFASYGDAGPYHGWVLSYDPGTLQQTGAFVTTTQDRAGIWQAGQGLTTDDQGNIYFMTGNGTFDGAAGAPVGQVSQYGNCCLKLDANLNVVDYFAPFNSAQQIAGDWDLGSAGLTYVPGTNWLLGGGKGGDDASGSVGSMAATNMYVFDRTHMGGFNGTGVAKQVVFTGYSTVGAPSFACGDGVTLIAGWGNGSAMYTRYTTDAVNWSAPVAVGAETTSGSVGISNDGSTGTTYIGWSGIDNPSSLNFMSTTAPGAAGGWGSKFTVGQPSGGPKGGPSLAFAGGLYAAFTAHDGSVNVGPVDMAGQKYAYTTMLQPGGSPETSVDEPYLTNLGGLLWLCWTGTDNPNGSGGGSLNIAQYNPGSGTLSNKVTLPAAQYTSQSRPALDQDASGNFVVLWRGTGNQYLNWAVAPTVAGLAGAAVTTVTGQTAANGMSCNIFQGAVEFAWRGTDANTMPNVAQISGTGSGDQVHQKIVIAKTSATGPHHIHGSPIYWNGRVYVWPEDDDLLMWSFDTGTGLVQNPGSPNRFLVTDPGVPGVPGGAPGMPGGFLSLSANGNSNGVIWANKPWDKDLNQQVGSGVLRAFDAVSGTQLWSSHAYGNMGKFVCPTIFNGKVYQATMGTPPQGGPATGAKVLVYGL